MGSVLAVAVQPAVAGRIARPDLPVLPLDGHGDWVARAAIAVQAAWREGTVTTPLLVVAAGEACVQLPAFASTQRAAHRLIGGYVLIDPQRPVRGEFDWPDAPVVVITDDGDIARVARLSGWRVLESETESWSVATVAAAIAAIADGD